MSKAEYALYLAVLPRYRIECIRLLKNLIPDIKIYCSEAHLNESIKTGIPVDWYLKAEMTRALKYFFVQHGHFRSANKSLNLIVDLNPRSLTSWAFLFSRRLKRGKRTITWGHLNPVNGSGSWSSWARKLMLFLSDGFVAYSYKDAKELRERKQSPPVWVAPNALFTRAQLGGSSALTKPVSAPERKRLLYIGRLEPEKKIDLLLAGFSESEARNLGAVLTLVGEGSSREMLLTLSENLSIKSEIEFLDPVWEFSQIADLYQNTFLTASTGFAGLGLTQSAGFGVPMAIAREENHSPEIELMEIEGCGMWFESNNPKALSRCIDEAFKNAKELPRYDLAGKVSLLYSADEMALGLESALKNIENLATNDKK
jgi:glycosyltransferase involved in cell wall biosynthesis